MIDTLQHTYEKLTQIRRPFHQRAQTSAKLTMPFLVPEDGFSDGTSAKTPNQGFGAHAVRTLASKILMTLLPPNTPFFKFTINKYKLEQEGLPLDMVGPQLDAVLNNVEREIMKEVELSKARLALEGALQHLIIAGNSLLFVPKKDAIKWYKLENYVLNRDAGGSIQQIITHDKAALETLPDSIKALLNKSSKIPSEASEEYEQDINIFTSAKRIDDKTFKFWQEVEDQIVVDSITTIKEKELPFIPLRFSAISDEDYGRGLVEEYYGTLNLIESLSGLLNDGAIAMGKSLIVLDKASGMRPSTLANKDNLSIISGRVRDGKASDVGVVSIDKRQDYAFVLQYLNELKREISEAFLLHQTRDAERVTAEEVRMVANELESVLGGVYSILSHEFQLPLLITLMKRMSKSGTLPKELKQLPQEIISPMIVTGLDALGRNSDFSKLLQLQQVLTPEEMQYINHTELLRRKLAYSGIPAEGLVKSQEQITQEQQAQQQAMQQQQQQALLEKAAPGVVKGMADNMNKEE